MTRHVTVNQLLFAVTLFRKFPEVYWFAMTNFCYQDVDYLENNISETFEDRFAARNIRDNKALAKFLACELKLV